MAKDDSKNQRYRIKPVKGEQIERKFNNIMDKADEVRRNVGAGQRMAGRVASEYFDGCGRIADWILGPGKTGSEHRKRSRDDDSDRQEEYDRPSERKQSRRPSGSGTVSINIELSDQEIANAMELKGIDPESVPLDFFHDVRKEFELQLTEGINRNIDVMLDKTVDNVDSKYTRKYGRS